MATSKKHHQNHKKQPYESFRVCKEPHPFLTFLFTEQTIYWSFLLFLILLLALWVLKIQLDTIMTVENISFL